VGAHALETAFLVFIGGPDMSNSKLIAGLVGPTFIALSLSEALNYHIWAVNIAPVTYLNGTLLFIAGVSILRAHNIWVRGWQVMATLAGWVALLFGMWRMFFPEAKQGGDIASMYFVFIMLFVIGVFLTFKAYSRET
jgi:hypothetical protein